MFRRLALGSPSVRLLLFGTFAVIVVMIAIAISFAFQPVDVRPSRVLDKTDAVKIPTVTPSQVVETVLRPPPAVENSVLPTSGEHAAPLAPSVSSNVRAVSPRARAEMPSRGRNRNTERRPARGLGLGLAPRPKSFTGAGFDAVH
jgi:hypothetical protein